MLLLKMLKCTTITFLLIFLQTIHAWSMPAVSDKEITQIIQTQLKNAKDSSAALYRRFNFEPLWWRKGVLTQKAKRLRQAIQHAELEGLNPKDYAQALDAFEKLDTSDPQKIAKADMRFTAWVLRFVDHLRNGRFNPHRGKAAAQFNTDPVEVLATILQHDETGEMIENLGPDNPLYAQLRSTLAQYRAIAKQNPNMKTYQITQVLVKGAKSPEVAKLRQLLRIYGDLLREEGDDDETVFTDVLEEAVKRFQERNTLTVDGVVGKETHVVINVPISDLIKRIIINMERLRWYPEHLGHKYIYVNLPTYQVMAFEKQKIKFLIPIIVGHPTRRTPIFNARLANLILNPSWGVPTSIMLKDKLDILMDDPGALTARGYVVYDTAGNVVDPSIVDWENDALNYRLRQRPGPNNALGEMRFTLNDFYHPNKVNSYTIFMHGTPEKNLFKHARRGFSSGCVRLQDPEKLAEWLLTNQPEWSCDRLDAEVAKGRTETVKLSEDIPVYFLYATVLADAKGNVSFGDDLYSEDSKLIRQMGL